MTTSAMEKDAGPTQDARKESGLEHAATHATYLQPTEIDHLSQEHREYLLARHGTLELDPVPTMSDADPYNWPSWKVPMPPPPLSTLKTNNMPENHQPPPRSLPRLHVDIHSRIHHPSLRKHRRRTGRLHPARLVPDIAVDRDPRRRAAVLASVIHTLRPAARLPGLTARQSALQHRVRADEDIRLHGSMPCAQRLLHRARIRDRDRRGSRNILQARSRAVHGHLDAHADPRRPSRTLHFRLRSVPRRVSLDILDPGHGNPLPFSSPLYSPLIFFTRSTAPNSYYTPSSAQKPASSATPPSTPPHPKKPTSTSTASTPRPSQR